ncbi:MAG: SDR family NAD(P)-dependent oxidoreductase [Acidimicrobiales bacterium]
MPPTPAPPGLHRPLARAADLALEATIAPSYTSVGFRVRQTVGHWPPPVADDLHGRTFLVTGASRGIGHETASMLLAAGAAVRSVSHSAERAEEATRRLRARHPDSDIAFSVADLTVADDLGSLASDLGRELTHLDGIAHCAGAFYPELTRTGDGIEANVALGVVAPHRLNHLLADHLAAAPDPRVAIVASSGSYLHRLDIGALDPDDPGRYRPLAAYAHTKRAQIVLTHAWARRRRTIAFDAMAPGWSDTELLRRGLPRFRALLRPVLRSATEGADTLAWLLARPHARRTTDRFWHDRRPRLEHRFPWTLGGDGPDELWAWCEQHTPARHAAGA